MTEQHETHPHAHDAQALLRTSGDIPACPADQNMHASPASTDHTDQAQDCFTAIDSGLATSEGWDVFDCGTTANDEPSIQIQRIDVPEQGEPAFADDFAAWQHVVGRAREGSVLHLRALAAADPVERAMIEARCGFWGGRS